MLIKSSPENIKLSEDLFCQFFRAQRALLLISILNYFQGTSCSGSGFNPCRSSCVCVCVCVCSVSQLCPTVTPWTIAQQVPLFIGFPRQEHWSGMPFPLLDIFLTQGSNPNLLYLLHWQAYSLPLCHLGSLETDDKCQFVISSRMRWGG